MHVGDRRHRIREELRDDPATSSGAAALRDAAGPGFDIVADPLYGPPLVAALPATNDTARGLIRAAPRCKVVIRTE